MNKSKKKKKLMNREMGKEGKSKALWLQVSADTKGNFVFPLTTLFLRRYWFAPTLEEAQFFRFTFLGGVCYYLFDLWRGEKDDAIQVLEFSRLNVERSVASIGGPVQVVDRQSGVVTFDRVQLVWPFRHALPVVVVSRRCRHFFFFFLLPSLCVKFCLPQRRIHPSLLSLHHPSSPSS